MQNHLSAQTTARAGEQQSNSRGQLVDLATASSMLLSGRFFSVAGEEHLLRALPRGNWIGGTIPYFMSENGGTSSRNHLFVTPLPQPLGLPSVCFYDVADIHTICLDAPDNGFTLLIIPAFSHVHAQYARHAPYFEDMFVKPIIGWVAGVHLDDLDHRTPHIINGQTGEADSERAVAIHFPLPPNRYARIDIVNLMQPDSGYVVRFSETGFSATDCTINGQEQNFAQFLKENDFDLRRPLVADYCGALINVSFKGINEEEGSVEFYAPVFSDVEYRFAETLSDYVSAFDAAVHKDIGGTAFSCNCILNYLYGELDQRTTGALTGPMTFGEIAYQLLNQTLVYMTIEQIDT